MSQLITKAVVKSDWLKGITGTEFDAVIDRLIDAVTEEIKLICNQPIAQEAVTLTFTASGGTKRIIYYTVPVSVTSVEYKQEPDDAAWTTVTGTVVFPIDDVQYLYNENGFSYPYYQSVLNVGYASVPADIQVCAGEMVKELWLELGIGDGEQRFGVSAISEGFGSTGTITRTLVRMRPQVTERLRPYMIWTA